MDKLMIITAGAFQCIEYSACRLAIRARHSFAFCESVIVAGRNSQEVVKELLEPFKPAC